MARALEGINVTALEQAVAAPLATSRLADAGARVIKLERPEGDFARGYDADVHGQSTYFVWNNRGKESCTVDLKETGDLALVIAMLGKSDVFVHNLAPGATERLGLGSSSLRARFPRLIVCEISGYAPGTPDYERKAYDLLVQAEAGLASVTGSATSGPSRVGISICDIATGQAAYAAILEALLRRERSNAGALLQISLFDTIAEYMAVPYLGCRYADKEPKRIGLAHPSIAPYGVFYTTDGEILIAIQNDREWQTFCQTILQQPDLASDPRFARNTARTNNRETLDQLIQDCVGQQQLLQLCVLLDNNRIAYGQISTMADLIEHRSVTTASIETPAGRIDVPAPPVIVNGARPRLGRVPSQGEHTEALRREFLPKPQAHSKR